MGSGRAYPDSGGRGGNAKLVSHDEARRRDVQNPQNMRVLESGRAERLTTKEQYKVGNAELGA
eukprot:1591844-Pyramimonas_sp.AAC.1